MVVCWHTAFSESNELASKRESKVKNRRRSKEVQTLALMLSF